MQMSTNCKMKLTSDVVCTFYPTKCATAHKMPDAVPMRGCGRTLTCRLRSVQFAVNPLKPSLIMVTPQMFSAVQA